MGSLVTDFIINPVLRQARRFSRSSPTDDLVVNQNESGSIEHDAAVEDIAGQLEDLGTGNERIGVVTGNISGTVLTSSPIEEDGGLEAELLALQNGRSSAPATYGPGSIPQRMLSTNSESGQRDVFMSDNPSFGIAGRFRTASASSSVLQYTGRNSMHGAMSPVEGPSRRSTQDQPRRDSVGLPMDTSLPADDGMGHLRQQILAIQSTEAPSEEKARLMHLLLTKGYKESQDAFLAKHGPLLQPAETTISQERPTTPSLASFIWQMNGSPDGASRNQHTFHLSPTDLKPTYAPVEEGDLDEDGNTSGKEKSVILSLGCKHYKRNVKMQCSTCSRWYTCRLCHNEAEDHTLIRRETKNMLCMLCGCAQSAGEFCVGCGERTAWYYCDVCKLWDNDSNKSIYHCHDCGICRKGRGLGKDFFHCKTCGTCMSMAMEQSHKCIERVSDCDCPICGEYMFTSPTPVVFMLCGHSIHKACYDEHMKNSYRCPICSKSTVNMESQFRNLDRAIATQPMPPEFRDTKAMVSCNDCYAKSAVAYHWLGLKCAICDSYNTVQLSILSDPAVVPTVETIEPSQPEVPPPPEIEESSSAFLAPGPIRTRRHSSHIHPQSASSGPGRFSPYPVPQRVTRSVSPIGGLDFFDDAFEEHGETDESVAGDDLDFWGRDEPRSVTSIEFLDDDGDEMDEESESEDSAADDCEEDDVDEFELLGHR